MLKKTEIDMDHAMEGGPGYEARLADLLGSAVGLLRRRYLTMLLVAAAAFAAAIVLILLMSPKYDAVTLVRIDPSRSPLSSSETQIQSLNSEAIETEVSLLSSVDLAREVVKRLRLEDDPEFTKGLDGSTPMTETERSNAVVQQVMRNLSVGREKLTYILSVKFRSRDPIKAARISNSFAETYLDMRTGSNMGAAGRQAKWLKQQLAELGQQVRVADAAVAQYRAAHNIVEGGSAGTVTDQQVAPLSSQLATAEADAAAAQSTYRAAQAQISRGGIDSVAEVRSSAVIGDLRRQKAEVLRNLAEIQSRDGVNHPEMIRVREQLSQIDQQINDEAHRVVNSLQSDASARATAAASLRGSLGALESKQASNTRATVNAKSLEQDAANKRAAFDRMTQMSLESDQAAQNSIAQAVIVDRASPPNRPTSPNRPLLAGLGLVVALALGVGTIVTQELLSGGLTTISDIESQFGIPVVASIPAMKKVARPADDLLREPTTVFAEALRNARASILGVRTASPPRVIAITSALPSEGKTTTALSFARILAMNGTKTLLIDCDVRKATLQSLIDQRASKGLVEVLQHRAQPAEAILSDLQPGLDLMMVNAPHFSGEDLFGGDRMADLVEQMKHRYDFIVLDLPPLMGVADARFLSAMADAVAFVVKWNSTPVSAIESSLAWLRSDNANLVGAIYTMVDPKSQAIGGFYYFQKSSGYYRHS
ncbi:MAG: chain-length determining protein [Sphingobium sp.]|nr:MAG: chain-length determining protein [Sphingobium sp.]